MSGLVTIRSMVTGLRQVTFELWDRLYMGRMSLGLVYKWVTNESQMGHMQATGWVTLGYGSAMGHYGYGRTWVTYESRAGLQVGHKWVSDGSRVTRGMGCIVSDGPPMSHLWVTRRVIHESSVGLQVSGSQMGSQVGHARVMGWVTSWSQIGLRWVTRDSRDGLQMSLRWIFHLWVTGRVTHESRVGLQVGHKWISDGSRMSHGMGYR